MVEYIFAVKILNWIKNLLEKNMLVFNKIQRNLIDIVTNQFQ